MNPENMSRDELLTELIRLQNDMENVVVLWGDRREFLRTFKMIAENEDGEYTGEEAANARVLLEDPSAFEGFIELVRDSFERGGINFSISEKISAIMQEVGERWGQGKGHS
jgi:hypothetical protein